MNRTRLRTVCIIAALACLAAIPLLRGLQRQRHPLVMDITCRESGAVEDFYWKINQVFIAPAGSEGAAEFHAAHTVPNFAAYYIKMVPGGGWKKLDGDTLVLSPQGQSTGFFIKAQNLFGEETAAAHYAIEIKNNKISVMPSLTYRTLRDIPFRFEPYTAPGMTFMREQTLPVAAAQHDEWQKFLALRSWVKAAIPFGNPRKDSNWNAAAILQEARSNPRAAFLCDEHAAVFVSACVSAGLNARMIHLRSAAGDGHYAAEVWSEEQQKWVYMDPLYDFSYCEKGSCFSTLDLHNLYLKIKNDQYRRLPPSFPQKNYLDLFHEFQIIMANDFLSHPYTGVWDLLSGRIPSLRWIDAATPPLDKWRAAAGLLLYYYVPRIGIPLAIVIGLFAGIGVIVFSVKQKQAKA